MKYYLIRFRPGKAADTLTIGCLRFRKATTWEQREESLKRWRAQSRPDRQSDLPLDAAMWLDEVQVENAP